jgi:CIC family chloride channel protein
VFGKFFCCSASLASGIALGREGPSVQVGAGIASVVARNLGLETKQVKALVSAACAAALAAAFNTPIAAVLFTLEEIMGDLHAEVLGSVVLSSVTSWVVLHLVLGDEPLFHVPAYRLVHPAEFGVYAVLGVVGGLGSVCFVKLLLGLRAWFMRLPKSTVWVQPAVGGLAVGLMGYFVPEVLGVGYNQVEKVLNGDIVLQLVVLLAVLKIVATAVCYGSGNAGGIFGPSLFMGSMMGAAVGGVAHTLFPNYTAGPGAYALVGMGTAFAGIVRTPLTSVIMIFEMTRDYTIIVPLMISNMIAFFISYKLQKEPIYEALAHQDGVHLPTHHSRSESERLQVSQAMRSAPVVLSPDMRIGPALHKVEDGAFDAWPVVGAGGLWGMIRTNDLEQAAEDGASNKKIAEILDHRPPTGHPSAEEFPHVHLDNSLSLALQRMGAIRLNVLPVVSRENLRQLIGIVALNDVLSAYGVAKAAGEPERRR